MSLVACTAVRAAFITGQMPTRIGLTTVGMPGASLGLDKRDRTLAEVLKIRSHLIAHFCNLYQLQSEEAPEQRD